MTSRALLLALVFLLLLPSAALAQEGGLELEGQVVNGTQGGGDVQGLVVALQGLLPSGQEVFRLEAITGPGGSFLFSGVVPQEGYLYRPVVEYGKVRYYGDGFTAQNLPGAFLAMTVYEATETDDAIRYLQQTAVVVEMDQEAGLLRILEDTVVENAGDRTYIGSRDSAGQISTVRVPLPPLAFDVVPGFGFGSQGYLVTEGTLADIAPLLPGQRDLIYSYSVAYIAPQHALTRAYPYPTGTVRLLVPTGSLEVKPLNMTLAEQVEVGDQTYDSFEATDLQAGEVAGLLLSRLPPSQGVRSRDLVSTLRVAVSGMTATTLLGLLLYALFRRRRQGLAAESSATLRAEMVDRLAHLEEAHQAGLLREGEYQSQRAVERQHLRDLLAGRPQDAR